MFSLRNKNDCLRTIRVMSLVIWLGCRAGFPVHGQGLLRTYNTVNPLYYDIRYNSKIRYNVNSVCTKNQRIVYFFIDGPLLFFKKTYVLDIY